MSKQLITGGSFQVPAPNCKGLTAYVLDKADYIIAPKNSNEIYFFNLNIARQSDNFTYADLELNPVYGRSTFLKPDGTPTGNILAMHYNYDLTILFQEGYNRVVRSYDPISMEIRRLYGSLPGVYELQVDSDVADIRNDGNVLHVCGPGYRKGYNITVNPATVSYSYVYEILDNITLDYTVGASSLTPKFEYFFKKLNISNFITTTTVIADGEVWNIPSSTMSGISADIPVTAHYTNRFSDAPIESTTVTTVASTLNNCPFFAGDKLYRSMGKNDTPPSYLSYNPKAARYGLFEVTQQYYDNDGVKVSETVYDYLHNLSVVGVNFDNITQPGVNVSNAAGVVGIHVGDDYENHITKWNPTNGNEPADYWAYIYDYEIWRMFDLSSLTALSPESTNAGTGTFPNWGGSGAKVIPSGDITLLSHNYGYVAYNGVRGTGASSPEIALRSGRVKVKFLGDRFISQIGGLHDYKVLIYVYLGDNDPSTQTTVWHPNIGGISVTGTVNKTISWSNYATGSNSITCRKYALATTSGGVMTIDGSYDSTPHTFSGSDFGTGVVSLPSDLGFIHEITYDNPTFEIEIRSTGNQVLPLETGNNFYKYTYHYRIHLDAVIVRI